MVCVGGAVGGRGGEVREEMEWGGEKGKDKGGIVWNPGSYQTLLVHPIASYLQFHCCFLVYFSFFNHWGAEHSSNANTQTGTMRECSPSHIPETCRSTEVCDHVSSFRTWQLRWHPADMARSAQVCVQAHLCECQKGQTTKEKLVYSQHGGKTSAQYVSYLIESSYLMWK